MTTSLSKASVAASFARAVSLGSTSKKKVTLNLLLTLTPFPKPASPLTIIKSQQGGSIRTKIDI